VKRLSLLSVAGREAAEAVMEVSLGKRPGDLAVMNGTLVNVYSGEMLEGLSLVIKGEWIAYVGEDPGDAIGSDTRVIDAEGKVVIPGLIDSHTHIADCLCSPAEFLRYAMKGGTTTIITEAIEPFPVGGYQGITDFLGALEDQPIKIFATVPAMASTSRLSHGMPRQILQRLLARPDVIGLGESFWQAVLQDPDSFLPNFEETLKAGKRLEGHTAGARGRTLQACVATGVSSCHEPITARESLERLRLGLYVMIREGSIRRDLEAISQIREMGVDPRRLILVTDGVGPEDLLSKGYMEFVVQKAIDCGFEPVEAVQMASINPAEYFGLDGVIGGIGPGRYADLVVIPEARNIRAEMVISKGTVIVAEGELLAGPREHHFSQESLWSVHLPPGLDSSYFGLEVEDGMSRVRVRMIDQVSSLVTRERIAEVPVTDGEIKADPERDILKVAALDRVHGSDKVFVGLMSSLPLPELASRVEELLKAVKALGFPFDDPHRTLVTLTGAAIPFLRICEEGLVDIKSGRAVSFVVKGDGYDDFTVPTATR